MKMFALFKLFMQFKINIRVLHNQKYYDILEKYKKLKIKKGKTNNEGKKKTKINKTEKN